MRDKRPVDELSIEELERILAIRKREARQDRLRNYEGRRITATDTPKTGQEAPPPEAELELVEPEYAPDAAPPEPPAQEVPAIPRDYYEGAPQFEEDLDSRLAPGDKSAGMRRFRVWWNRALMGVEIAAVIGLLALFVGLFQSFQQISQTTAGLQAEYEATHRAGYVPPTATPIINIAAVVLPSGHTFKGDEAVFNLDEVPAQYRDQYAALLAQLPVVRPTPSPEEPIRVRIPRLNVDNAVVAGDDWEALKLGAGHMLGSANPGQRGNMVLSAHNDIYGELFRHLDQLQPGDQVIVSTRSKDYTYTVQPNVDRGETKGYRVVNPTDTWALEPQGDNKMLTLVSCYPYRVDTKRIIVFATLLG